MRRTILHRTIAFVFDSWVRCVRAWHWLRGLVRPRVRALDHVTIPVHDLELARRFYCDVLGATLLMTIDDAALARFGRPPAPERGEGVHHHSLYLAGSTRIDLFLQHDGQTPALLGHSHFAFRVAPGQLLPWKRRLEALGIPTDGPMRLGFPGQASMYFNDPSGNHLELVCHGFGPELPIRAPELARLSWHASGSDQIEQNAS